LGGVGGGFEFDVALTTPAGEGLALKKH
jgi:hypothetical protein